LVSYLATKIAKLASAQNAVTVFPNACAVPIALDARRGATANAKTVEPGNARATTSLDNASLRFATAVMAINLDARTMLFY
jgi:hypothetical protein